MLQESSLPQVEHGRGKSPEGNVVEPFPPDPEEEEEVDSLWEGGPGNAFVSAFLVFSLGLRSTWDGCGFSASKDASHCLNSS